MNRLAGVVLLLVLAGCWARRPVKVARTETSQPRLLGLGATVGEHFVPDPTAASRATGSWT